MSTVRWTTLTTGLRRTGVRLDSLAVVPASLIPHKAQYQAIANRLPDGSVLVVLPTDATPERRILETTADRFRAKGHHVLMMEADQVLSLTTAAASVLPAAPLASAADPHLAFAVSVPVAERPAAPMPPAIPQAASSTSDVPAFQQELRLVSVDASRNRARFYILQWHPTLWGNVALVRIWGRIGSAGRARVLCEMAMPAVDATVTQVVRHRLRHGYQVVDWH